MSFKKGNVGCCNCDKVCEIGFIDAPVIDEIINAFPNAHGNAYVDDTNINSSVWGTSGNKALDIVYWGYPYYDYDPCQPIVEPDWLKNTSLPMTGEIANFIANGGKFLVVAENTSPITEPFYSAGCFESADVTIFNKLWLNTGSTINLHLGYNLDPGCQGNTNIVTAPDVLPDPQIEAMYNFLTNGVDQINVGGCGKLTSVTGFNLLMSKEDDTVATIIIEPYGSGYHLAIADSNMFDSCLAATVWFDDVLLAEDGKFTTFLDNFCSIGSLGSL